MPLNTSKHLYSLLNLSHSKTFKTAVIPSSHFSSPIPWYPQPALSSRSLPPTPFQITLLTSENIHDRFACTCLYIRVLEAMRERDEQRSLWLSYHDLRSPHLFYISLTCSHPGDHSSVIRVTSISAQLKVISGTNERVSIICTWARRQVCQALPAPNERKWQKRGIKKRVLSLKHSRTLGVAQRAKI